MSLDASVEIREIRDEDNPAIARIIRDVLREFGADRPGFAWQDPELDLLSRAYDDPGRSYFVVFLGNRLVGGGGFAPFQCEEAGVCELQKMYLLPNARHRGIGKILLDRIIVDAARAGYRACYLETFSAMTDAIALYQKNGFASLEKPMGASGHSACNIWYLKPLNLEIERETEH